MLVHLEPCSDGIHIVWTEEAEIRPKIVEMVSVMRFNIPTQSWVIGASVKLINIGVRLGSFVAGRFLQHTLIHLNGSASIYGNLEHDPSIRIRMLLPDAAAV
ncbi:hypothetical protein J5Y10_19295 [Roseomonas sp. SG15]|uniref:Uncharacterized protein n=2 Tax=Roseomonas indoligenes TaxID=2820811 RepID=A0A940S5Y7_9PROT|nr:hypothetical protein [Pararoseomonas indoligenes]